jgi:hypothetical protein
MRPVCPQPTRNVDGGQLHPRGSREPLSVARAQGARELEAKLVGNESKPSASIEQPPYDVTAQGKRETGDEPNVGPVQHDFDLAGSRERERVPGRHEKVGDGAIERPERAEQPLDVR